MAIYLLWLYLLWHRGHPDAMLELARLKFQGLGGPADRPGALADVAKARAAAWTSKRKGGEVVEFPHPYRMRQGGELENAVRLGGMDVVVNFPGM